ncbi:MAG: glycosyltransferase [Chloroflexota bacterium]
MSRFAKASRVFFVEEPQKLPAGDCTARLDIRQTSASLSIVVPRLPSGVMGMPAEAMQRPLLKQLFMDAHIQDFVLWYYTPMALGFTRHLPPALATVYDCMDELSAFRNAPAELMLREAELFQRADLVFTGGHSLFEAKRGQHPSVHAFPSSVDVSHFARARRPQRDPKDQARLGSPRLGFFGVLDERLDVGLLAALAQLRPEWHFVMLGPIAKIDPAALPRRANIHYLGQKSYAELPAYLAGWDVALIPFARNDATRFISPTKTPEYLAAGRPVVSTSIHDVVQPYGNMQLVRVADEPAVFVAAVEAALAEDPRQRLARTDPYLSGMSWDRTWGAMELLIRGIMERRGLAGRAA